MNRTYALANQKGGVGKTTTAVNLGAYLSTFGLRVLIVDGDPQSNATSSLGIDKRQVSRSTYEMLVGACTASEAILSTEWKNLFVVPASPGLAGAEIEIVDIPDREHLLHTALDPVKADYDYLLIDCPPSLSLLTINALAAAHDGVIVPIQCEYLALEGLTELLNTISLVRERISPQMKIRGMLMTMHDPRTNLSQQVVNEVKTHFGRYLFETVIPRNVSLGEAPSFGMPIMAYSPRSAGARAYQSLTLEMMRADGWQIPGTER
jgi:chromosome partitioning protein